MLVCGGRDLKEYNYVRDKLDALCEYRGCIHEPDKFGNFLPNVFIISGGAKGADSFAIDWAIVNWCQYKEYEADWGKYGKKAGPIRNQQMLDEGNPDLVVAFPTKNSRGTFDMIRRANKAGVETIIY